MLCSLQKRLLALLAILMALGIASLYICILDRNDGGRFMIPNERTNTDLRKRALRLKKKPSTAESTEKLCTGRGPGQRIENPLCANLSSLVVFSRMKEHVRWQLYLHKREAEKCVLPNNAVCFLTDDYSFYQTADVLMTRDCSDLCNRPAYSDQLVIRYNQGRDNHDCRQWTPDEMRISYQLNSTIPYPYVCYPETRHPVIDAINLDPPSGRHGIVMFISDPKSWRRSYLKELMKHIDIVSYGSVLHNTEMSSSRGKGSSDFIHVKINLTKDKGYKFLIAFENSIFPEYVTEKIWHGYLSQAIPIYYGTSDVYNQVPGANTFIDATKFDGPQQLAEYIKKIDQDDSLYKSFFNFDIEKTLKFQKNCPQETLGCAMCNYLYKIKQERCDFL